MTCPLKFFRMSALSTYHYTLYELIIVSTLCRFSCVQVLFKTPVKFSKHKSFVFV